MTIAALITLGIGPGGSVKYALTGGLDLGATIVVVAAPTKYKFAGPAPGSYWPPKKFYLPPGWEKKKPTIAQVKKLYVEARKEIPPKEQRGLLPARLRLEGKNTARLPPARLVDFDSLRGDLAVLRSLIEALVQRDAIAAAEVQRKRKKRRDEDALMFILLNL